MIGLLIDILPNRIIFEFGKDQIYSLSKSMSSRRTIQNYLYAIWWIMI